MVQEHLPQGTQGTVKKVPLLRIRKDPFTQTVSELAVNKIATRKLVETSEMPEGLLNVLTEDEILDLIAYLSTGGNPNHQAFQ